jgi:hypothetical protein
MIQIDVIKEVGNITECLLYADGRAIKMFIGTNDYVRLVEDNFFIRDGKERDSANVLNTTEVFYKKGDKQC